MKVRTRIAPSPTGEDIHIGNLYTALINYAVAKKNNGQFIVRIEDTDRQRYREGAEGQILASLKAFGLIYDEGPDIGGPYVPYRQSERLPIYKNYAEELIEKGAAYYCFCTKKRLEELREQQIKEKKTPRYDKYCLLQVKNAKERIEKGELYVIRLNVLANKKLWFKDLVREQITIDSNEIDDQVLLKSDGYPTYHLGVVVDDHLMEISHIIRAEEWISSTPKHVLLYESFGWDLPVFAHVPILRNPDKSKLSKRKNPVWASWYLKEGFLPEAVLNYLALLGWSHPEEKEIFSLDEFIRLFKLEDLNTVGPVFDIEKLKWMNGEYIRNLSGADLAERLKEFYKDDEVAVTLLNDEFMGSLMVSLAQTRMKTLKDFKDLIISLIVEARNENEKNIARSLSEKLSSIPDEDWNKEQILAVFKGVMNEFSIRMPILYYIFTGKEKGLPLPETLEGLRKKKTLERLADFVK